MEDFYALDIYECKSAFPYPDDLNKKTLLTFERLLEEQKNLFFNLRWSWSLTYIECICTYM